MNSVYPINRAVDKPIVFRGLKGQWIVYLCMGLLMLLLLFALCYIAGVPLIACIAFTLVAGSVLFYLVYSCNKRYGEHGLMKELARKAAPKIIVCDKLFLQ